MARTISTAAAAMVCALLWLASLPAAGDEPVGPESGESLYRVNCGNCHGPDGDGFMRVYPPLQNSIYLRENVADLPCLIRLGLAGEIVVDGQVFNGVMPGNDRLSGAEIAKIISYMQKTWGHPETELDVETWLEDCR